MNNKPPLKDSLTFHKNPFFVLAIFFSLGIIVQSLTDIPFLLPFITASFLIPAGFFFLKKNLCFDVFILFFFLLLGMLSFRIYDSFSPRHIYYKVPAGKNRAFCVGTVVEDPVVRKSEFSPSKTSFKFRAEFLKIDGDWMAVEGDILVNLYDRKESFEYADRILIEGEISRPRAPGNPYQFDYKRFLARERIFALFKVAKSDLAEKIGVGKENFIKRGAFRLRRELRKKITSYIPPPQAEILCGVLLGFRQDIPQSIEDVFVKTGTMHLLAISGLHVGLLIAVMMLLLKLTNMPRKARFFLILLFLVFYVPLTGARIPVMRASIMAAVLLIGFLFDREANIINSLGIAALAILLFLPHQLFSVSFQLSFICLLSIIYFSPKIESFFKFDKALPFGVGFYLRKSASVSLAAWMGTLPLTIHYFNNFSLLTIIANLAAIPLLFLTVIFSVFFILSGAAFLAGFWARLASLTTGCLLKFLDLLSVVPFGFHRVTAWPVSRIVIFYFLLIVTFNFRRFKTASFYVLALWLFVLSCVVWPAVFEAKDGVLKISFFDVGFADAILVEFPKGGNMLIDAGSFSGACGRNIIAPYLWNRGIKRIEGVVLTHPESDHLGGLNYILRNFEIGAVFDSGQENKSMLFRQYADILDKKNITRFVLSETQVIEGFEDVEITVLHPPAARLTDTSEDLNNNSVVLKLSYKDFSIILPSDVQAEGLRYLLRYRDVLEADVVKVPHHGLETGSEVEVLLEAVKPRMAVISAGTSKRDKINRIKRLLAAAKIKSYNTADTGFISIETDGTKFETRSFREI